MTTFEEAYKNVMNHLLDFGVETIELLKSNGRVLAEDVYADRDFPPFNRAAKDGIVIRYSAIEKGADSFGIEAVLSAGMPQKALSDPANCMEIMTGAVVPNNADTVIMYEKTIIENGVAKILKRPNKGQDIHKQGSDVPKGTLLLKKGTHIRGAEVGVLASVGKSEVLVKKLPRVCVISTGNELVEIHEKPLPHQIRKSNALSLYVLLQKEGITAELFHLRDDKESIKENLYHVLKSCDVLLLSGGVSKGKFDFIPEVMEELKVKKVFHRVAQKPGKPFWFGIQEKMKTVVFSFPGNPVSTFANYHIYFLPWLHGCLGLESEKKEVLLEESIQINPPLTRFIQAKTEQKKGRIYAKIARENGSGDLTSLPNSDGFICLTPRAEAYEKGEAVQFVSTRN